MPMRRQMTETSRRTRARFVPRTTEAEGKRPIRTRMESSIKPKAQQLNIIPTSKIVEKLYEGQTNEVHTPPALPPPPGITIAGRIRGNPPGGAAIGRGGPGSEEGASFAWQPTEFSAAGDNKDDMYNWEYFLDSSNTKGPGDEHEFDSLFLEDGDEYAYDHYYESDAYNTTAQKKKSRACTSCQDDDRMCKMEKCTIS
mmetsp:Transcript_14703/g.26466  ORF Transcript_14703/g.26466 Transcript_14703/m.26466 type:complete len:198 (-) Transcript_14703:620-1213(-)|eukprot:CAMPEP_0197514930 /NCGR_PEP_ID=MMETSP1318-20131121/214_1 /TAXON_ID=552666 /ORGANISM="Partenskyella glossopodia, Strain RCC365" /LENGTH=197 /DNA_ID=CAMNT_0043063159 /DNA_START=179 /DNA_END=772 /DNA_ORIENTATION=-